MRIIIAGDRNFTDYETLCKGIAASGFDITTVVSGCARGADTLGERWADEHGVPVDKYPADWDTYGRAAGPIRNAQMADNADALVAFLAPGSKGTKDMVAQAYKKGLSVHVVPVTVSKGKTLMDVFGALDAGQDVPFRGTLNCDRNRDPLPKQGRLF